MLFDKWWFPNSIITFVFISWHSSVRASLLAQMVKSSPAMQQSPFNSWVGQSPWRRVGYPPSILGLRWWLRLLRRAVPVAAEPDTAGRRSTAAHSAKGLFSFPELRVYFLYLHELRDSNIINGYNFYNHHFAQLCLMLVNGNPFKLAAPSFDTLTFLKLLPYSSLSGTERCFRLILFYQPHPALSHFSKEWLLSVKLVI